MLHCVICPITFGRFGNVWYGSVLLHRVYIIWLLWLKLFIVDQQMEPVGRGLPTFQ